VIDLVEQYMAVANSDLKSLLFYLQQDESPAFVYTALTQTDMPWWRILCELNGLVFMSQNQSGAAAAGLAVAATVDVDIVDCVHHPAHRCK
jgi:hypothetical protein